MVRVCVNECVLESSELFNFSWGKYDLLILRFYKKSMWPPQQMVSQLDNLMYGQHVERRKVSHTLFYVANAFRAGARLLPSGSAHLTSVTEAYLQVHLARNCSKTQCRVIRDGFGRT